MLDPGLTLLLNNMVHLGYTLQMLALIARDVLLLRVLLATAQCVVASFAAYRGVYEIAGWNVVLIGVNLYWIIRILRERRAVTVPEELAALYQRYFSALSAGEFLRLWALSERQDVESGELTREAEVPDRLYWLREGSAEVLHAGRRARRIEAPCFVGEMSLLTGRPATATVRIDQPVSMQVWSRRDLAALMQAQPGVWARVQSVLGLDLVFKIQREEARLQEVAARA